MDEISFKLNAGPFYKFLDDRGPRVRRTALYSLRATGRVVKAEAKRHAPVLKDPDHQYARAAAYRRAWTARKQGMVGPIAGEGGPVVGLLKQSIASSRQVKGGLVGPVWSIKVGPRGPRVHLYAAKEEVLSPYMVYGHAAGEAAAPAIWHQSMAKVWRA